MLINSLSSWYPFSSRHHTIHIEKYDRHGLQSSTTSRPSRNSPCHSKTRDRDVTSSPCTSVDERKLSVADFPSFTGSFQSIRCSILSSGTISDVQREQGYSDRRSQVKTTERRPDQTPVLLGATTFMAYKYTRTRVPVLSPVRQPRVIQYGHTSCTHNANATRTNRRGAIIDKIIRSEVRASRSIKTNDRYCFTSSRQCRNNCNFIARRQDTMIICILPLTDLFPVIHPKPM